MGRVSPLPPTSSQRILNVEVEVKRSHSRTFHHASPLQARLKRSLYAMLAGAWLFGCGSHPAATDINPTVCETGERVVFVREGKRFVRPDQAVDDRRVTDVIEDPRQTFTQVVVTNKDLEDEKVIFETHWGISKLSYHCGTGRVAFISGPEGIKVFSDSGEEIRTIAADGHELSLSPDGQHVALMEHNHESSYPEATLGVWRVSDGMKTVTVNSGRDDTYMWARDSTGIFALKQGSTSSAERTLGAFHPTVVGTEPAEYPTCDPRANSATTGSCAQGTMLLTGHEESPKPWTKEGIRRGGACQAVGYSAVTWSTQKAGTFPNCPMP